MECRLLWWALVTASSCRSLDEIQHDLLSAAVLADDASDASVDLGALWTEVLARRTTVVQSFCTEGRCYLVLEHGAHPERAPQPLAEREVEFLRRSLLGQMQKSIALDFDLAPSTIAISLSTCLRAIGFDGRASRIPILAFVAAHALYGHTDYRSGRSSEMTWQGRRHRVVSVVRPDLDLRTVLAPAESAVARLLAEGRSYAEIAKQRNTSLRTTANQVASAFHKLGVSGRGELLCSLVRAGKRPGCAA
jgi:DNA-binding NarL/FixJ family response regulator